MLKFEYILIIPGINNLRKSLDNWKQQLQITKSIGEQQMKNIPALFHCGGQDVGFLQILCVERSPFKATEKKKEQEYYDAQESQ